MENLRNLSNGTNELPKNDTESKIVCPFNENHIVSEKEYKRHMITCQDRKEYVRNLEKLRPSNIPWV